jgi:hypothetical protein
MVRLTRRCSHASPSRAAAPAPTPDGITAGDYLAWFRDAEPFALGRDLRSIDVAADPLGDTIAITLWWSTPPPPARLALAAAGFAVTQEVSAVVPRSLGLAA